MPISEGKSLEHWRNQWDNAKGRNDYDKAMDLFKQYNAGYQTPLGHGFGSVGRLFKGHWKTHNGSAVESVIGMHCGSTLYAAFGECCTIPNLLADLKKELGDTVLKPKGDLARIIKVIEEKSHVNYEKISLDEHGIDAIANDLSGPSNRDR